MSELNTGNPKIPEIPVELWMLWDGRDWLVSVDELPGGATYLVALSEAEAIAASLHQWQIYGVETTPVRVDGARSAMKRLADSLDAIQKSGERIEEAYREWSKGRVIEPNPGAPLRFSYCECGDFGAACPTHGDAIVLRYDPESEVKPEPPPRV